MNYKLQINEPKTMEYKINIELPELPFIIYHKQHNKYYLIYFGVCHNNEVNYLDLATGKYCYTTTKEFLQRNIANSDYKLMQSEINIF